MKREVGLENGVLADPAIRQRMAQQELDALVEPEPDGRVIVAFSRPRPDEPASWRLLQPSGEMIARWPITSDWVWRTLPEWTRGPIAVIPAQATPDSTTAVVDLTR